MKKFINYIGVMLLGLFAGCNDNQNWTVFLEPGTYVVGTSTVHDGESHVSKLEPVSLSGTSSELTNIIGIYQWLKADGSFTISVAQSAHRIQSFGKGTEIAAGTYQLQQGAGGFTVETDGFYQLVLNTNTMVLDILPVEWEILGAAVGDGAAFGTPTYDANTRTVKWIATTNFTPGKNYRLYYSEKEIGNGSGSVAVNTTFTGLVDTLSTTATSLVPLTSSNTELRSVGSTGEYTVSILYSIVGREFTATKKEAGITFLYVPGAHSNWGHDYFIYTTSPNLPFSGFMYITGEFKFSSQANWDGVNYGDGGDGSLSTDGTAGNLSLPQGLYKLTVNVDKLTWSHENATWSLIGSAVGGWDAVNDVPMTAKVGNTLTVTTNLAVGEFKFRLNSSWDTNLGIETGFDLKQDGANIPVGEAGNYTIKLDLSNPPAYTYSITKN